MASLSIGRVTNGTGRNLEMWTCSRRMRLSCWETDLCRRQIKTPCIARGFRNTTFQAAQAAAPAPSPPFKKTEYKKPALAASAAKPHEPPPPTARNEFATASAQPIQEYKNGLADAPAGAAPGNEEEIDWTRSFSGLSTQPFSKEAGAILMQPLDKMDIEVKPDGIVYLPEIKYRRILNRAFGPGGWGLAPRGETIVTSKSVTREYALLAHGRLVSVARGEQGYFDPEGIPTATEGCKSNALMRCCKDLGVASELWDPRFIRQFLAEHAKVVWVEHVVTKKRKKITTRKDDEVRYPFQLARNDVGARASYAE